MTHISHSPTRTIIFYGVFALVGLALVAAFAGKHTPLLTVTRLLEQRDRYTYHTVRVSGTITTLTCHASQRGHAYYVLSLRDMQSSATISVFAFGYPAVNNGQLVTVVGRYTRHKRVGPWSIEDEIDATYGRITPGCSSFDRFLARW